MSCDHTAVVNDDAVLRYSIIKCTTRVTIFAQLKLNYFIKGSFAISPLIFQNYLQQSVFREENAFLFHVIYFITTLFAYVMNNIFSNNTPATFCLAVIAYIVASSLKDPICHSNECQIGSFSSEATICIFLSKPEIVTMIATVSFIVHSVNISLNNNSCGKLILQLNNGVYNYANINVASLERQNGLSLALVST